MQLLLLNKMPTHFISILWNVRDILLYYHIKLAILVI